MHEAFADRICGDLPGAERQQPFGPGMIVWTIERHMFAAYTEAGDGLSVRVEVGAELATATAMAAGPEDDAPSLSMKGAGWVLVPWATPPHKLRDLVRQSYDLVREDRNGATEG